MDFHDPGVTVASHSLDGKPGDEKPRELRGFGTGAMQLPHFPSTGIPGNEAPE
jgi:hypothetical protein